MSKNSFDKNVFINCPFDEEYNALLRPLIFCIIYFGYNPRIALEDSDSGISRLEKILNLIEESKYSIHDLSRLQAKKSKEFYRLNMPFELGLDYASRRYKRKLKEKRFLILEKNRYDYMKALSDINGFDIKNHENNPEILIECLHAWFTETANERKLGSTDKIYSDFIEFNKDLFLDKMNSYIDKYTETQAEEFASKEIKRMPLPEFMDEIREWLN